MTECSVPRKVSGRIRKPKSFFDDEARKRARKSGLDAHFSLFNEMDFKAILALRASLRLSNLSRLGSIAKVFLVQYYFKTCIFWFEHLSFLSCNFIIFLVLFMEHVHYFPIVFSNISPTGRAYEVRC